MQFANRALDRAAKLIHLIAGAWSICYTLTTKKMLQIAKHFGMRSRGLRRGSFVLASSLLGLIVCLTPYRSGVALESPVSLVKGVPSDAQRVMLAGHIQPLAQQRYDTGAVPGTLPMMELKVVLRRSATQDAALQTLLAAQQTAGSPQYHQWLTPAQFGARFGASSQDIQALKVWLQMHSFKVGAVSAGRAVLPFSGTAAQVEAAFQTPIHYFIVDGVRHFANTANPEVPAAFQSLVSGVRGLHDFRAHASAKSRVVSMPAIAVNGNNYVTPADYAVIYNFVPLYKGNISGAGVTVAVAAQSDIDLTIPANYWSAFGVNQGQQLSSVAAAAATDPGRTNNRDESEAYLDVEIIGGLAPNAKIVLVRDEDVETAFDYAIDNNLAAVVNVSFSSCENSLGSANASVNSTFKQAAAQGITVAVSAGDGGIAECDDDLHDMPGKTVVSGLSVNGFASTPYNIAVGGTDFNPVLVQAGDYWNTSNSSGTYANAKSYIPEMVWNETCVNPVTASMDGATNVLAFCNNASYADLDQISGGGGGVSSCITVSASGACATGYAQPAWQTGVGGLPGSQRRSIPDVALLANDWVACDQTITTCGVGGQVGIYSGTSASAPAMSAIVLLLDQALISNTNTDGRQGNINPTLYRLAAAEYGTTQSPNAASLNSCNANNGANIGATCVFNDVTTGSNGQPCSVTGFSAGGSLPASTCASASGDTYGIVEAASSVAYGAGAAYDLASGLGSINAANLVQTITGLKSPTGLTATVSGTTVNLSWTSSASATAYDLYQGTASEGEGDTPVQSGITATSATVTGLQAGQTYYFLVSAVTPSGISLPSNEANATLAPAAPTGVGTSGTATTITLAWTASYGANTYSVLEGSTAGGEAATPSVTGITGTSYSLAGTPGKTDYFQVIAVNEGGSSAASSEVSGTVLPTPPTGLIATGGNASVTLSWAAGQGAASYKVFEGASAGKEASAAVMTNVSGTTTTVTGLANGTPYYFTVASVNAAGSSAPSNEANATTATPSGGGSLQLVDLLFATVLVLGRLVVQRRSMMRRVAA
jgi:subtilase family serine protease